MIFWHVISAFYLASLPALYHIPNRAFYPAYLLAFCWSYLATIYLANFLAVFCSFWSGTFFLEWPWAHAPQSCQTAKAFYSLRLCHTSVLGPARLVLIRRSVRAHFCQRAISAGFLAVLIYLCAWRGRAHVCGDMGCVEVSRRKAKVLKFGGWTCAACLQLQNVSCRWFSLQEDSSISIRTCLQKEIPGSFFIFFDEQALQNEQESMIYQDNFRIRAALKNNIDNL